MRKVLVLAALSLAVLSACQQQEKSPFTRKVADYPVVTFDAPDLSGISDNGKEVLNLYRFAAAELDAMYWEQYFGDKQALLDGIEDPAQKTYAEIQYGPWDRTNGESFIEGYENRLPGANFYPADMTEAEFAAFEDPAKNSPYTLIRRGEDGALKTVWFHDAYRDHIEKIANYLTAAADITIKPSVKKYLLSKAEALRTDNYYQSDIDWLEMDDSKMDLVLGPNETDDDQLFGLKRSYEAFVLLKNEAKTQMLMKYVSRLEEFQKDLPCDEAYKTFQPGTGSNIFSCDALYYAGKANAGVKVIALNLPYDADVQRDKGTRTILLENVIRAKFNYVVSPAGNVLLDDAAAAHLSSEAFFWNIVFREVAQGLGVKETVNGLGSVEQALGNAALTFEVMKANAVGALLVCKLQDHFDIRDLFTKEDALTTFFVSLARSERFGEGTARGRANTMIFNYLHKAGAFTRQENGRYVLDYGKMESTLAELSGLVLKTQATGDSAFATAFIEEYAQQSAESKADVYNLSLENVPLDIRFAF